MLSKKIRQDGFAGHEFKMTSKIQAVRPQASEFQQYCGLPDDSKSSTHRYGASVWSEGRHSERLRRILEKINPSTKQAGNRLSNSGLY